MVNCKILRNAGDFILRNAGGNVFRNDTTCVAAGGVNCNLLLNQGGNLLLNQTGILKLNIADCVAAVAATITGQIKKKLRRHPRPVEAVPFDITLPVFGLIKKSFESDDVITFGLLYEKVSVHIPYKGIKVIKGNLNIEGTSKATKKVDVKVSGRSKKTFVKEFKAKGKQDFSRIRAKLLGLFKDDAI